MVGERRAVLSKNDIVDNFVRYAEGWWRTGWGKYVDFWLTINEPKVYSMHAYLLGRYPPNNGSILERWRVANNLILAHNQDRQNAKNLKLENR